jgi:long-chain fatty acid transport protein
MVRGGSRVLALSAVVTAGAVAGSGAAEAAGFAVREGSADWMANAFAGEAAKAYDASTAFTNPAGMVRLNANEIDAPVNAIFPSSTFTGANFVGSGQTTPGTQGDNLIQAVATPAAFAVWSFSPDLKFGFAATTPFGQRVTNPTNFVGRYQSLVSSITDFNFSISAAYRINEHISIGGGPVIDYFKTRLTQAANIGVNQLVGDPVVDLHGDNVAAGFNLGALYQFDDNTRVGIDYRSRITHTINGTRSVFVPPVLSAVSPATAAQLRFLLNTPVSTDITLPDSVTLGFYRQIDPQWAVMADVQWTHWSLIRNVSIVPSNGTPVMSLPQNWRNTWFAAIGANYRVTDKLLLQAGFAYDESPVTDRNRTTRIPDSDRYDLAVGATYSVLPNVNLQAAYVHAFFSGGSINNSAVPSAGLISGSYSTSADAFSLGATVKF